MSNREKNLSTFFLILSFVLFFIGTSEANFTGTIGARFTISGAGFGDKKPAVYVKYEKPPGAIKKVSAKIENYSDTSIACLWTAKLPAGTYNLFVQPKIKGAEPINIGTFSIMNPSIDDVTPATWSDGEIVTIRGKFFSTKKPTVYLEEPTTLKRKKCKVLNSVMDPWTGVSSLQFLVPKGGLDSQSIILKNNLSWERWDSNSKISKVIDSGVDYYNNLIVQGNTTEEALVNTVDWYSDRTEVVKAYVSANNQNIFIKDTTGITTLFIPSYSYYSYPIPSASASFFLDNSHKELKSYDSEFSKTSPTGIKALVMDPYILPYQNSSAVYNLMKSFPGIEVTYLKGLQVTPETFKHLSQYDLIYYVGHGGVDSLYGTVYIGTGEPFSQERKEYYQTTQDYINKITFDDKHDVFNITSNFISDYSQGLKATAIFIDACQSLYLDKNDTMASAFINNGAKSYFGWGWYSFQWLITDTTYKLPVSFFKDILSCKSVSEAFKNLPFDYNIADLHYRGDGNAKLPGCENAPDSVPESVSVNPSSGNWTSSPQDVSVSSGNAGSIYYTIRTTTDGSTPADPPEPTSSLNDGSISGSSGNFQVYASAGQNKKLKVRFRGNNSSGYGPTTGSYLYSIDLSASILPGSVSVNPSSGSWTSSPQNVAVGSSNATSIYYTIRTTTDGTTPVDPPEPSSSLNDGSISGSSGTFQVYATAGQNKKLKVRFRGYNGSGYGPTTGSYLYSIDLSASALPGSLSVNPSSGNWTSSPQNLGVNSDGSTTIYYRMVNTYDGSTPSDPAAPTSTSNDGSIIGPSGTFQLYASAGQYKKSKLRFIGCNSTGCGTASGSYVYSIDLSASILPNLTPYKPITWSDSIVVSRTTGTNIDNSPLSTTDTLYVDWAVINNGSALISTTFYTYLYVDGVQKESWYTSSLQSNYYANVLDFSIGTLSPGTHTIKIVGDATGVIAETNESDNTYTKTITVQAQTNPTIAQNPMSGPPGTTFSQWGTGFSPNSTSVLHFKKPDGTEYPTANQTIDGNGTFSITYSAPTDKPAGTYTWWAIDNPTGKMSNTVSYTITVTVNPTIAQNPMSGPPGTTFSQWGTGFTPNSTATLHFRKPDGTEYPTAPQSIKSDGSFSITYTAPTSKAPGTYTWWAVDEATGKVSNSVSYTITVNPVIAQTPMSGPPGTTFSQWGTGFTANSTATLHFRKPDGTEYPTAPQAINPNGTFSTSYTAPSNKSKGTYSWWGVDGPTGKVSNTVSYTIN